MDELLLSSLQAMVNIMRMPYKKKKRISMTANLTKLLQRKNYWTVLTLDKNRNERSFINLYSRQSNF